MRQYWLDPKCVCVCVCVCVMPRLTRKANAEKAPETGSGNNVKNKQQKTSHSASASHSQHDNKARDRVLVIGADLAVGALTAARLGQFADLTVTVQRHDYGVRIQNKGIWVHGGADGKTVTKLSPNDVRVVEGVDKVQSEVFDIVIVACKTEDLPALAPSLKALSENDCYTRKTTFLFAQDGVPFFFPLSDDISDAVKGHKLTCIDPNGVLADAVPVTSCLGCALFGCGEIYDELIDHLTGQSISYGRTKMPSYSDTPLIVTRPKHEDASERIHIGAATTDTYLMSKADSLVRMLCKANLDVVLMPSPAELWTVVFNKLMGHLSYDFIAALTLCDMGMLSENAEARELAGAVMAEARAVGEAAGVTMTSPEERLKLCDTKYDKFNPVRPSALQELLRKRPMEMDILAAYVELAKVLKVDAPRMATLLVLTRMRDHARADSLIPKHDWGAIYRYSK